MMVIATAHAGYIFQVLPDKADCRSDQKSQACPDFRHYGRMTWPSTKFMLELHAIELQNTAGTSVSYRKYVYDFVRSNL